MEERRGKIRENPFYRKQVISFSILLVAKLIIFFFALSQNCENRLITSSRLFVSLFSMNNSVSARGTFVKFYILQYLSRKFKSR